ncbi:rRNA maturation RNase YbeY [Thorsellia kenyensis]|uniref:Endoribonuclease YbeY n=1 Tax=Thorsellia kenyensis TaxID=1549888 RepID=A0ABV6CCC3_9GAMM
MQKEKIPSQEDINKWVSAVLCLFEPNAELTLRIVEKEEIQSLNSLYRKKDKPTNVLSFPAETHIGLTIPLLGDLIICRDVVQEEALEQGKSFEQHFAHMIIHGCLHLLGYDHIDDAEAEEMEAIEIEVLHTLGYPNPYELN